VNPAHDAVWLAGRAAKQVRIRDYDVAVFLRGMPDRFAERSAGDLGTDILKETNAFIHAMA
jgi:hypothetical protein